MGFQFINKKIGDYDLDIMDYKYDHEIKKMIIHVNVMLINVNNREKKVLSFSDTAFSASSFDRLAEASFYI